MATKNFNVKIKQVCHTTAEWQSIVDIIDEGILCIEFVIDGSGVVTNTKAKVGDGKRPYANLPYIGGDINLTNYYTKAETESFIDEKITSLGNMFVIKGTKTNVSDLPTEGNSTGDVWFVGESTGNPTEDVFDQYVWTDSGEWVHLGKIDTTVDDKYTKYSIEQDEINPNIIHFTGVGTDPVSVDITIPQPKVFQGATVEDNTIKVGTSGAVPAPSRPDAILFGDGSWHDDITFNVQI